MTNAHPDFETFWAALQAALRRYEVSVARFDEDVEWTRGLPAVIGNKGPPLPPGFHAQQQLPNVGKDQHTHVSYIVERYDDLPEWVVFMQARWDDHPCHAPGAATGQDYVKRVLARAVMSKERCTPPLLRLPLCRAERSFEISKWYPEETPTGLTFGEWCDKFVGPWPKNTRDLPTYLNGIFATHRDNIRRRPKAFWEALLREFPSKDCEAAHYMERAWHRLLTEGGLRAPIGPSRPRGT